MSSPLSNQPLDVLFIGGTGEISASCVEESLNQGHRVTVFNRGKAPRISGVEWIEGDVRDNESYHRLVAHDYDVVCQFLAFRPEDVARDVELFSGRCGQYVFVSSASAYQKPWPGGVITETVPLENPFMEYSRNKAACELALADSELTVTIVRPSHTYRERLPSTVIDGVHLAWRIRSGKPVIIHDDGESLWTLTRSEDFARAFVGLFGRPAAFGETYHITNSEAQTWIAIFDTIAELMGETLGVCHVATEVIAGHKPEWAGPLLGDKANSLVFDNSKVSDVLGGWQCEISLREGLERTLAVVQGRLDRGYLPDQSDDALIDRIISQSGEV